MNEVRDVSSADFDEVVIKGSQQRLVVVDFWAPWCGPCRALTPVLEKLADDYAGKFLLAKVNADDNQQLCIDYSVRGIPSVKAFSGGVVVDEFTGAMSEAYILDFIDRNIPSPTAELIAAARQLTGEGKPDEALVRLDEALALEPENAFARVEKAVLLLDKGEIDAAAALVSDLRGDILEFELTQQLLTRLRVATAVKSLPDEAALKAALDRGEHVLQSYHGLATHYAVQRRYEEALAALLEVMKKDVNFAEGAARKDMLAIFELLGNEHALVHRYRRAMANLLH